MDGRQLKRSGRATTEVEIQTPSEQFPFDRCVLVVRLPLRVDLALARPRTNLVASGQIWQ